MDAVRIGLGCGRWTIRGCFLKMGGCNKGWTPKKWHSAQLMGMNEKMIVGCTEKESDHGV